MKKYSTFVGMDVHKNSIEIAIAERGRNGEVRSYGKIDGTLNALDKVVRKLVSKGDQLHFVYEAGPCGYGIYRHLTAKGYDCSVVAPSRIPKKSGDRIKNDRRDACVKQQIQIPFDVGRRCLFNRNGQPEKKVFQPIQIATYALSGVVFSLQILFVIQYGLGEVHGALLVRYDPLL